MVPGRALLQRRAHRRHRARAILSVAVGGWGGGYVPPIRPTRSSALQTAAVERVQRDGGEVDVVQAAHVERDHLAALRRHPAREGGDPALGAEQVVDAFL